MVNMKYNFHPEIQGLIVLTLIILKQCSFISVLNISSLATCEVEQAVSNISLARSLQ